MTEGSSSKNATITYFNVIGNSSVESFLDLSSHEVGHLPQIDKEGGYKHLTASLVGYIKAGWKYKSIKYENYHDKAPYEASAEKGSDNFKLFKNFVNKYLVHDKNIFH